MIFHNILFLFKKIIFSLQHVFTAGAGFSKIPRKYETVVFIIKILETGKNVFKCNFRIIKNKKKYYEICVSTRSAALRLLCTQYTGRVLEEIKWVPICLNREILTILDEQSKVSRVRL